MELDRRVPAGAVVLDLDARNKTEVLEKLAAEAAGRRGRPEAEILKALQDREKLGSTALGRGVALPHARLEGEMTPLVLFARLAQPVDFEARDEEPVDLVILVLWPDADADGFLPELSVTCRALREPQALRRLRGAESVEEVAELLARYRNADPDEEV